VADEPIGERLGDTVHGWFKFGSVDFLGFNPFSLESFLLYMGEWGISRGLLLWVFYIGLLFVLRLEIPQLPLFAVEWLIGLAPIWLPITLYYAGYAAWVWYIQSFYLAGRDPILLEMKVPRDVFKSPRAMELAIIPMNLSSGETTFINRGWQGGVRPFWSFEIASFGGEVHFYVWTWRGFRPLVESSIYSYYPEVELVEVEDYAAKFRFDPSIHDCYCTEWRKESFREAHVDGSVPSNGSMDLNPYPIKTYVEFELDKDPKEEFKIDPLAETVEFFSSIRPEDQVWVQIAIREAGRPSTHVFFGANDRQTHLEKAKEQVRAVRVESVLVPNQREQQPDIDIGRGARGAATVRHQRLVEAMDRNMDKYLFEVGIRGWIVSTKEVTSHYYNGMRFMWRPMGDPNVSTWLRPRRWHPPFDYPWQDYKNLRWNLAARRFLDAYRRRLFFHSPWRTYEEPMILSGEEIATIWHPIARAIAAPGVQRLPAKKAEPPANLPK
jgi:hypothetical protein